MSRIAVYSGSFNPLHIGHQAIMEYLTGDGRYDWVYLVVSPHNPLKEDGSETGRDRYQAAIEAVKRHPTLHIWVDDIELDMDPPQYTIKTLDALKRREPENDFTLVIGADNLENIHKWRDFRRILSEYGVAVYPRKGFDMRATKEALLEECRRFPVPYVLDYTEADFPEGKSSLEEVLERRYRIELLDAPPVNISSTEIRKALDRGEDVSQYLM